MIDLPEEIWAAICEIDGPYWQEGDNGVSVKYIRDDFVQQWRPMKTAPKDGTRILVFDEILGVVVSVQWYRPLGYFGIAPGLSTKPTAWMPVPTGPEKTA